MRIDPDGNHVWLQYFDQADNADPFKDDYLPEGGFWVRNNEGGTQVIATALHDSIKMTKSLGHTQNKPTQRVSKHDLYKAQFWAVHFRGKESAPEGDERPF